MARRPRFTLASVLALALGVPIVGAVFATTPAAATTLPAGFSEQVVLSGLNRPTKIVFAPDGRIFIAEKRGTIKVFNSLSDPTPDTFADLSSRIHDYEDEGLIGLAVPPNFPSNPYVYVAYTYDAPIGGTAPTHGDGCTTPTTGCVVSGRLSRLRAAGNVMTGTEQVLINDWCTQFETHQVGNIAFGPDGALYVSGGEGASPVFADWGSAGSPTNPCGDPPGGVGGAMSPPTAEGGALRAQDLRSSGDPVSLGGTLIRVDPVTGAALPSNPLYNATTDPNGRRIVAYGLRNPYRWAFRPGTSEVWFGDVGWRNWEEINRLVNPLATPVTNFGWPCYEGTARQPGYDGANLNLCETLYTAGTATPPLLQYSHSSEVVAGDGCPTGGSSPTGIAFYPGSGGGYPAQYAGALFFADYARQCIWAMRPGANGVPNPANVTVFAPNAAHPVDLAIGPDNDLYYVDIDGGTVRRIHYSAGNQPPTAVINANPTAGPPPLAVSFSGTGSSDPDTGDVLTYQWDFTNDGVFDATGSSASFTYGTAGSYTARLRVTDAGGLSSTSTVQILAGTSAPVPTVDTPAAAFTWATGDVVNFAGHATDAQDGAIGPAGLSWDLVLQHCSTVDNCHQHFLQTFAGTASGSFVAPDHEYPSYLELRLTATDSGGLQATTTRRLDPKTSVMTFQTSPSGLQLTVGSSVRVTPFSQTVIQGSTQTVSAAPSQDIGSSTYTFGSWSNGGAATHVITAPATSTTYTATYQLQSGTGDCSDEFGYVCATQPRTYIDADTVLPLTGDDAVQQVSLPFPVRLYGQQYSTAWVDTNGVLSLVNPGGFKWDNTALPAAALPNAAVYPFWDDLVVDADASVRTETTGTAPNRRFVVEWRNVRGYGNLSRRLSFEAILSENGDVVFNYKDVAANDFERGAGATIGIENASGTVGLAYSVNTPKAQSGVAVVYTAPGGSPPPPPPPPLTGTVSGTVTVSGGGPVAGATVTLTPGGLTGVTNASGGYSIGSVPHGAYTASVVHNGQSASAPVTVDGSETVNLTVPAAPPPPPPGDNYTISTLAAPFVPADATVLPLTGDDAIVQITLPAPITLYGQGYSTAWVDTNGKISFVNPGTAYVEHASLPTAGAPNATVYPFWADLVVDASASVRTAVVGGSFVVEWRNVHLWGNLSRRLSFSIVFAPDGTITMHYTSLDNTAERGAGSTVGVENANGTMAAQHVFNQPNLLTGTAVRFTP